MIADYIRMDELDKESWEFKMWDALHSEYVSLGVTDKEFKEVNDVFPGTFYSEKKMDTKGLIMLSRMTDFASDKLMIDKEYMEHDTYLEMYGYVDYVREFLNDTLKHVSYVWEADHETN